MRKRRESATGRVKLERELETRQKKGSELKRERWTERKIEGM